jgi:hypothetical protein
MFLHQGPRILSANGYAGTELVGKASRKFLVGTHLDGRDHCLRNSKMFHNEPVTAENALVMARHLRPRIRDFIEQKLEAWLGLKLNREKTRIVNLRRNQERLEFLGYQIGLLSKHCPYDSRSHRFRRVQGQVKSRHRLRMPRSIPPSAGPGHGLGETQRSRPERSRSKAPQWTVGCGVARPPFTLSRNSCGYDHFPGLRSGLPGSRFPPLIAASSAMAALPSAKITKR